MEYGLYIVIAIGVISLIHLLATKFIPDRLDAEDRRDLNYEIKELESNIEVLKNENKLRIEQKDKEIEMWKERGDRLSGAQTISQKQLDTTMDKFVKIMESAQNLAAFQAGVREVSKESTK